MAGGDGGASNVLCIHGFRDRTIQTAHPITVSRDFIVAVLSFMKVFSKYKFELKTQIKEIARPLHYLEKLYILSSIAYSNLQPF